MRKNNNGKELHMTANEYQEFKQRLLDILQYFKVDDRVYKIHNLTFFFDRYPDGDFDLFGDIISVLDSESNFALYSCVQNDEVTISPMDKTNNWTDVMTDLCGTIDADITLPKWLDYVQKGSTWFGFSKLGYVKDELYTPSNNSAMKDVRGFGVDEIKILMHELAQHDIRLELESECAILFQDEGDNIEFDIFGEIPKCIDFNAEQLALFYPSVYIKLKHPSQYGTMINIINSLDKFKF